LIATALEHNRDLRIAAARVEEARAQYGVVRADKGPSVNLLGTGSVVQTPASLSTTGVATTSSRYDLSVSSVSFELDFWGRIAGLTEAARVSYLATEEARRAVYLSLVADVASSYFTLMQMNELMAFAQATVESREKSLAVIASGLAAGGTYDYEFQQARGFFESAQVSLDGITHQRAVALNHLSFLVGYGPVELLEDRTLEQQGLDADLTIGLPAEVLLVRPDVMAAEQRLIAAHANIDAARAAFLPKVLLSAGIGAASQGLAGLFAGGVWSFQPAITLPLFDGGRIAAVVDVAEARKVIAVAEYEKTIQQAFREVADLLSARTSFVRQLRASTANAGAQAKRLEIAQARYQAGLISYLEILDGQRELVAAEEMSIQVRRAQLASAAQLYKALGGGLGYQ
jgi:multidrug efflux system outer membrane protein